MIAEEKSHICLEGDVIPATDNYLHLQSIYNQCLEGETILFKKGQIPWNKGKPFLKGEKNPMFGKHPIPWNKGIPQSEVAKKKSSDTHKELYSRVKHPMLGRHHSDETITKLKKRIVSEDTKKKISDAKRGKPRIGNIPDIRGKKNPMYGKHHSEGVRKKQSEAKLEDKNPFYRKHHTEESKKKSSKANRGRKRDEEIRKRMSENHTDVSSERNPNWRGGVSFIPYCPKFNNTLKEKIRERDYRLCQLCHEKENGRKLPVHHIHYDKENCYPDLIALCAECNSKVNFKRDYYENLFMIMLNERGLLLWTHKQEAI